MIIKGAVSLLFLVGLSLLVARSHGPVITVQDSDKGISVSVVQTVASRSKGLSDHPALGINSGMLFIFDEPTETAFWMKDMRFNLDIIWIDSEDTVVSVTDNVATSSFPDTFPSPGQISKVLEINAGYAEKWGIEAGDQLTLNYSDPKTK